MSPKHEFRAREHTEQWRGPQDSCGSESYISLEPSATAGAYRLKSETVSIMIDLVTRGHRRVRQLADYFCNTYSSLTATMSWVDWRDDKREPPSRRFLFFFIDHTPELAADSCQKPLTKLCDRLQVFQSLDLLHLLAFLQATPFTLPIHLSRTLLHLSDILKPCRHRHSKSSLDFEPDICPGD